MKKYILSFGIIVSLTSAKAQVYIENHTAGDPVTNISGATIVKSSNDGLVAIDVQVKLASGSGKFLLKRVKISGGNAAWTDQICWGPSAGGGGGCTPANGNSFTTPDTLNLTNTIYGIATLDINPNTASGLNGLYRYYVINAITNQQVDSVDINLSSSVSIKETKGVTVSIFPNPATEYLNITTNTDLNVKIVDVLGKVIYVDRISGSKKIDLEDFKNGVYIVTLSGAGIATQTRRIVVKK
jgi:hypothetical protein